MRNKSYLAAGQALWLPTDHDQLNALPKDKVLYESGASRVVSTAPGILIKYRGGDHSAEVLAFEFARKQLSIPVPRILAYPRRHPTKRSRGLWYFAMERCSGISLDKTIDTLTTEELDHIARQLSSILTKMASYKPTILGAVNGGPYRNFFFPDHLYPKYAFANVGEFIDYYRRILMLFCTETYTESLLSRLPRNAPVRFVHGDLHPGNIIVEGSTITGIIDWHTAGFYPDYWEYCRMYDPYLMRPNWNYILGRIFPGEKRQEEIYAVRELIDAIAYNL